MPLRFRLTVEGNNSTAVSMMQWQNLIVWSLVPHVTSHSNARWIPRARVFLYDGIKPFRSIINVQAGWVSAVETWFGTLISSARSRFWPQPECCLLNRENAVVILGGQKFPHQQLTFTLLKFHHECWWAGEGGWRSLCKVKLCPSKGHVHRWNAVLHQESMHCYQQ